MKTQILIEAEMTDKQLEALLSEIKNISEIIGLKKLEVVKNKPQYVTKGDYCAVCGGTEFWNDEEE